MLEQFTRYSNFLWDQKSKALSDQVDYQTRFIELFQKIYISDTKQIDVLTPSEMQALDKILNSVS